MFSHINIGTNDFSRAFTFYSAVMDSLSIPLKFSDPETPWAAWKPMNADRPLFIICSAYNKQPAAPGNGQMIALLAPSRHAVDTCYETAIAHGAQSEGAPGLRPQYHSNYYGAYFRDLDGNKVCVCCHTP